MLSDQVYQKRNCWCRLWHLYVLLLLSVCVCVCVNKNAMLDKECYCISFSVAEFIFNLCNLKKGKYTQTLTPEHIYVTPFKMTCIRNYKQVLCTIVQHMREKQFLQFLASNVKKSITGTPSSSLDQKLVVEGFLFSVG